MTFFEAVLRPLIFRLDAERAHDLALAFFSMAPSSVLRVVFGARAPAAPRQVCGLGFRNPVGLAAGMDKAATALPAWEALGFGFAEIGTITAHPQPGNPKPRVFRYPKQQALINRMGFNNPGAEAVAARLGKLRVAGRWPRIPIGINIGKSKVTPLEEASSDYLASAQALAPFADYFAVNVSSPNTPGLRDLQGIGPLRDILRTLRGALPDLPLLVKIAPDLPGHEIAAIAELAVETGLAGIIATNTTLDHSTLKDAKDEQGGLSGAPLEGRATKVTRLLARAMPLPVVASGGIMTAPSAAARLAAGATLVQIYTGFIYHGPALIRQIAAANR